MTSSENNGSGPSPRRIVVQMMALTSALFFFVFLLEDIPHWSEEDWANVPWSLVALYIALMAAGGAICGALFSFLFGRRGIIGWVLGLLGGLITPVFAGILGSVFSRFGSFLAEGVSLPDLIAVGAGAMLLPFAVVSFPLIVVPWFGLTVMTHLWARKSRLGALR